MLNFNTKGPLILYLFSIIYSIIIAFYALKVSYFLVKKCVIINYLNISNSTLTFSLIIFLFILIIIGIIIPFNSSNEPFNYLIEFLRLLYLTVIAVGIGYFYSLEPDGLTCQLMTNSYVKVVYLADISEKQEWVEYAKNRYPLVPDYLWLTIVLNINLVETISLQDFLDNVKVQIELQAEHFKQNEMMRQYDSDKEKERLVVTFLVTFSLGILIIFRYFH